LTQQPQLPLKQYLAAIEQTAVEAGEVIMDVYARDDFNVSLKGDESPLTAADLASHHLIDEQLVRLSPDLPILSEESDTVDWHTRRQWQTYWLVDPLDGTKEFIERNGEFTVNIALIDRGVPVLGVIYAPVQELLYSGIHSPQLSRAEKVEQGQRQPLQVKPREAGQTWLMLGSRHHHSTAVDDYLKDYQPFDLVPVGSSLKFGVLAEGRAHQYPRMGPTGEWDTAAGQAILEAAGGAVIDFHTRQPLRYNQKASLLNPDFIATADLEGLVS